MVRVSPTLRLLEVLTMITKILTHTISMYNVRGSRISIGNRTKPILSRHRFSWHSSCSLRLNGRSRAPGAFSYLLSFLPMLTPHIGSRRAGCTDTYCAPGTRRRRTTTGAHFGRCRASEHARDHQVSERSCLCGRGPCYRCSGRLLRRRSEERSFCAQTVLRRCRGGVASSSVRTTRTVRDLQS